MKTTLAQISHSIIHCHECPRLREYCLDIAQKKKREFREWTYWGKPVPGFGDPKAKIWIIGLAPAAHGANRTGRMFTGDSSGKWLYRALYLTGFSTRKDSIARDDGLRLSQVYISSAARCAPPENKPTKEELCRCSPYLSAEFKALSNVGLFVALGAIGFQTVLRLLRSEGIEIPRPLPTFRHGAWYHFGRFSLLCSYHPSRQNTQTGKLTETMWMNIFDQVRDWAQQKTNQL